MNRLLLRLLLLVSLTLSAAYAQVRPQARTGAGCLVMNKKIYCYGGRNSSTLNDFYYLDVSKDFALQDGQSSWQPINAGGLQPGPNSMFGFVPLYELGVIVLQGGTGPGNGTAMPHTTMIYDPNTNNWRSVDIPNAPPQTYQGTTTSVSVSFILQWGGKSDSSTGYQNGVYYPPQAYILNYQNLTWSNSTVPTGVVGGAGSNAFMTGVTGQNGVIYYFGGMWANVNQTLPNGANTYSYSVNVMNTVLTFDTKSSTWAKHTTNGTIIPQPRGGATLTLIPYTNTFVMYGGADLTSGQPVDDYCYLFDTANWEWKRMEPEGVGPGPRSGHNAVMVGNSSLFVLFGEDSDGNSQDEFHILDVSNWAWQASFSLTQASNVSVPNNSTEDSKGSGSDGSNSNSLSGGAIAGIVIGCVAAVAISGALVAVFVLRKKRHNSKEYQREAIYQEFNDDNNHIPPPPRYYNYTMTMGTANMREQGMNNDIGTGQHRLNEPIGSAVAAASFEDDQTRSYRPDVALNLKPDTREEDDSAHNVPHLRLQPLRPDGE